jgi:FixJ family two-component response regulator
MGGPELVDKLKQRRQGFAVIFMSGYTDAAAIENAKIGADATLLNKPFSTEVLANKISEVQLNTGDLTLKGLVARNSG